MTSPHAIADTTPSRTHLRLVVLAQWIRAGLALARSAATGGGLVSGAIALWRVAQAVRLAMRLAQLLKDAAAARAANPASVAPGLAPHLMPTEPVDGRPTNADALRRALAELASAISANLGLAPHHPPMSIAAASLAVAPQCPRPDLVAPPCGKRPDRPPGALHPRQRRWRAPRTLNKAQNPIAALAIGRLALACA
jgi:hypothetical protein